MTDERSGGADQPESGRPESGSPESASPAPEPSDSGHANPDQALPPRWQDRPGLAQARSPRPKEPRPVVFGLPSGISGLLIGLNVAVWLLVTLTGGHTSLLLDRLGLRPLGVCRSPGRPNAIYPDADVAACEFLGLWMPGAGDGAPWQLVTNLFVHADGVHLAMNMLALWMLGPYAEQILGPARFTAVYLLSGLAGSALVFWLVPPLTLTGRRFRGDLRAARLPARAHDPRTRRPPRRARLAGDQPDLHLRRRQHLLAGPPRRADRRADRLLDSHVAASAPPLARRRPGRHLRGRRLGGPGNTALING